MPQIAMFELMQEISSFNPSETHYDDFVVKQGADWLAGSHGALNEIGGALGVFTDEDDVELVPTISAKSISSGGPFSAASWEKLSAELVESLEGLRDKGIDGAYFCMHGAMASPAEMDPEGYILEKAREILGENIPIVTSMDLHGIVTDRMLKHSDAIVVYHTYPHVDQKETGERSARLLMRLLREDLNPVTVRVRVPALVRGDELITDSGIYGECIRLAQKIEESDEGLSAGMFIGNPFTDVPELCTNSLVVIDGNKELAEQYATEMAELFWVHRERMQVPLTSLEDAVEQTKKHTTESDGTVVLVDAADATSSGASGDSNAILAALYQADYQGRLLFPIVDEPAVRAARQAGVGNDVELTLGGTIDSGRYTPLTVQAKVRMVSDGDFHSETFNLLWHAGPTVVLEVRSFTVVVSSRAVHLFDRSFFRAHGQEPSRFDAVVMKSPHCEPQMFKEWASLYLDVDAPGSTSANLKSLGHTICERPMFPLDENVVFEPRVEVHQR
ncbi:MAG: microcystin degradation protein MlrC [Planctomycetaceae bacterium]|nr:microcystin degradation protein MlrC [Planctomycetaceae bacterium]|tara:strand:- start:277 stop:1785 length:1509 start_codon:yes stop_codon:yes gene_type:complete